MRWIGLHALQHLSDPRNTSPGQWSNETHRAVHLALDTGQGDDLHKNNPSIKIMSGLIRVLTDVLNKKVHTTHNNGTYGYT